MQKTPYQAPDFTIDETSLSDFRGKWLVLYFYPKDDTPGCTVEACSFRDARDELTKLGANVVGISKDDASSHEKFKAKHTLNFALLSDTEGSAIKSYDAWGKKMFGREGILRKTFIINPEGYVVKVYNRVTPVGHANNVVQDLKKLQQT
jgi:peroxiredoxin Q/BCP